MQWLGAQTVFTEEPRRERLNSLNFQGLVSELLEDRESVRCIRDENDCEHVTAVIHEEAASRARLCPSIPSEHRIKNNAYDRIQDPLDFIPGLKGFCWGEWTEAPLTPNIIENVIK